MKSLFFSMIYVLIFLSLSGCSLLNEKKIFEDRQALIPTKTVVSIPISQKSRPTVVVELLELPRILLHFKNVDTGARFSLNIQKEIKFHPIGEGHWELIGFVENEKNYVSLETSKKFVFHARPKSRVYAGSIIFGCPRVANKEIDHLKNMKFFNRYQFSSEAGICELVIGNDQTGVQKKLRKTLNSKNLSLTIGF